VLVAVRRVQVAASRSICFDTDLERKRAMGPLSCRHGLYGGDRETRIQQEIFLGVGGVRVLKAMGSSNRRCYHLNEGHPRSSCCSASRSLEQDGRLTAMRSTEVAPHDGVHHAHAGGPAMTRSLPSGRTHTSRELGATWGIATVFALGHYDNGSGPAVQHDRAGAAHRRQP